MPDKSDEFAKATSKMFWKLKCLEDIKMYASLKKGTMTKEVEKNQKVPKNRGSIRVKNFELTLALPGEW